MKKYDLELICDPEMLSLTGKNAIADEVTHAMAADIQDENVLRRMGVTECDCAIVAFATSLQDNILVTLLLKEEMEAAARLKVRLLADVNWGYNWYDAK